MKKSLYIFIVLCLFSGYALAQETEKTIVEELNTSKWGQGDIKIMQDEALQKLVAVRQAGSIEEVKSGIIDPSASYTKAKGYKIQVYSGNNQARSKSEAFGRKARLESEFPDYEANVTFQSPFWRLRVGNFLNREDAEEVLKEMKKAFPSFGREMNIVSDVVKRQD